MEFQGTGASEGTAWGKACVFRHKEGGRAAEESGPAGGLAGDFSCDPGAVAASMERFCQGRERLHRELCAMAGEVEKNYGPDKAGIFEGYAEIIMDDEIEELVKEYIMNGEPPARSARKALEDQAREILALDNSYMRERGDDLLDLGRQLEAAVAGETLASPEVLSAPGEEYILVADDLSPFETVRLDRRKILGLALDKGGYTGHVAILARSLGLPCVVALGNASASVETGAACALDGASGRFIVDPDEETLAAFRRAGDERREHLARLEKRAGKPALTLDGFHIPVCANIGSAEEGREAALRGADGAGLFRTEFLYLLDTCRLPTEDEQFEKYRETLEALQGRPLTIRTLDIGGDKEHPALGLGKEENPFLGYRAIRIGLDRPEILKPQLRAILRIAGLGPVEIMFPMVISAEEIRRCRALAEECLTELAALGIAGAIPPLGIMVETPAAALMAREFAALADFFSIGTNDLTQYTLAADRGNERISSLYDPLHPAVLRLIAMTCEAAEDAGIPVCLCGELAGDEKALPLLIGLGLGKLSVSPARIPAVKEGIRGLDRSRCRELARRALSCPDAASVRKLLGKG